MSTQIYYFSGTGNSIFAANELGKCIPGSEIVPVVRTLKQEKPFTTAVNIGFVFPCHGMTIPLPVKMLLEKLDIGSASYFFAVVTRGGTRFRGFKLINRLLSRSGGRLNASLIVDMPMNDPKLESFNVPDEETVRHYGKRAAEKLRVFAKIVRECRDCSESDTEGVSFTGSSLLNFVLEHLVIYATHSISPKVKKYFYADSKCTGCGICSKVCLSGKIRFEDGSPVWNSDVTCFLCYSCLNYCPAEAVQILSKKWMKSYTTERGRYPHPYAGAAEIAAQKQ